MKTAEIAKRYLDYFEKNDHVIVPSASLVTDDPALLFTVAGMVPFIPYLSGDVPAPFARAADIPEVHPHERHRRGRQDPASRHVLPDARQLVVRRLLQGRRDPLRVGAAHLGRGGRRARVRPEGPVGHRLRRGRRGVRLWQEIAGLPEERIQRLGKDTNYWSTGLSGTGGALLGDLLRPRSGVRHRRRPCDRRRPLRRDLEPRVHAVRDHERDARSTTSTSSANCRRRTSTPAWAWSASRSSSRASTTCTRPIRSGRCSTAPSRCRGRPTGPSTRTTSGSASSPTTSARRSCCCRTASRRPTTAAATSFAV